jgi:hypothetical protein
MRVTGTRDRSRTSSATDSKCWSRPMRGYERAPGRDGIKVPTRPAPSARQRGRTRALQAPQSDGRAGVRAEQVQPWLPPLPATRQSRGAVGVAVPGSNPQPAEAPHTLDKPSDRLSGRDRRQLPLMTSHRSQTKTPRSPNFARQPRRRAVGFAACQEKKRMSSTCALWVLVSALVAMPSSSTTPPRIFRTAVYPGSRMRYQ